MPATPRYAARIARLPRVFELLEAAPDGVPLAALAEELGVPAEELREDLLAFYTADIGSDWLLGLTRPSSLEFLGAEGDEVEPAAAEVVRLIAEDPAEELGVEYVDASELALVYAAASALLDLEPANDDLAAAVAILTETMLDGVEDQEADDRRRPWNRPLPVLEEAIRQHRAVHIEYSRAWDPGVAPRVIHPYRLEQTRRGWEVDAGPLDDRGRMRTYLLSNIREVEALDETFVEPDDLPARLAAQRETTTVRVCLPHAARWAADMYAESVAVGRDDEELVTLDVELLPPLERRVGMLLLASGPDAFVVSPRELEHAGTVLAEELLVHHSVTSE